MLSDEDGQALLEMVSGTETFDDLDLEQVNLLRRIATSIAMDPMTVTPQRMKSWFPHGYVEGGMRSISSTDHPSVEYGQFVTHRLVEACAECGGDQGLSVHHSVSTAA